MGFDTTTVCSAFNVSDATTCEAFYDLFDRLQWITRDLAMNLSRVGVQWLTPSSPECARVSMSTRDVIVRSVCGFPLDHVIITMVALFGFIGLVYITGIVEIEMHDMERAVQENNNRAKKKKKKKSIRTPPAWQDEWFDIPLAALQHYTCAICQHVMQEPIQTPCGHAFCRVCIRKWLRRASRCPMDQLDLQECNLFPDRRLETEMSNLKVKCSFRPDECWFRSTLNKGLSWKKHAPSCRFQK